MTGRLPAVVHLGADAPVVEAFDRGELGWGERWQAGRSRVLPGLPGAGGTGDHRGDPGLVDDPAQRGLRGRHSVTSDRGELACGIHPGVVVDAGEGLADIELFAMAVVGAVVVG